MKRQKSLFPALFSLLIPLTFCIQAHAVETLATYKVDQTKAMDFEGLSYQGNTYFPNNLTFKMIKNDDGKTYLIADYTDALHIKTCETFDTSDLKCRQIMGIYLTFPSLLMADMGMAIFAGLGVAKPSFQLVGDESEISKLLNNFANTRPNRLVNAAYASLAQGALIYGQVAKADCVKAAQEKKLNLIQCEVFVQLAGQNFNPTFQIRISTTDKNGMTTLSDNQLPITSIDRFKK